MRGPLGVDAHKPAKSWNRKIACLL